MYCVTVRDSMMIAHSLRGAVFGPAQRLHGATYVVEITLCRPDLDENGIVADIGRAAALLRDVLAPYAYRNLDDLPEFSGRNTTTEILAKTIFERYADGVRAGRGSPSNRCLVHHPGPTWTCNRNVKRSRNRQPI